jgi:hypothetical protein
MNLICGVGKIKSIILPSKTPTTAPLGFDTLSYQQHLLMVMWWPSMLSIWSFTASSFPLPHLPGCSDCLSLQMSDIQNTIWQEHHILSHVFWGLQCQIKSPQPCGWMGGPNNYYVLITSGSQIYGNILTASRLALLVLDWFRRTSLLQLATHGSVVRRKSDSRVRGY